MSDTHRIILTFDDGLWAPKLIHPEGGCATIDRCGECGRDLNLAGAVKDGACAYCGCKIELAVEPRWTGGQCELHIIDVALPNSEQLTLEQMDREVQVPWEDLIANALKQCWMDMGENDFVRHDGWRQMARAVLAVQVPVGSDDQPGETGDGDV
jgi:DNA-directed RNA polymerase subunit RPC12/RpoP